MSIFRVPRGPQTGLWVPQRSQKRSQIEEIRIIKMITFSVLFWRSAIHEFVRISHQSELRKSCSRVGESSIFTKSRCAMLISIFLEKSLIWSPQIDHKSLKNLLKIDTRLR